MNTNAIENIQQAFAKAMAIRPKVGGFPYLAETLRQAGILKSIWHLPSCQSVYHTSQGTVVSQGEPLLTGFSQVSSWSEPDLIAAIRKDQAGESEFSEFLLSSWKAGVVSYVVDFEARTCTYFGANEEMYIEDYPSVELPHKFGASTTEPYDLV